MNAPESIVKSKSCSPHKKGKHSLSQSLDSIPKKNLTTSFRKVMNGTQSVVKVEKRTPRIKRRHRSRSGLNNKAKKETVLNTTKVKEETVLNVTEDKDEAVLNAPEVKEELQCPPKRRKRSEQWRERNGSKKVTKIAQVNVKREAQSPSKKRDRPKLCSILDIRSAPDTDDPATEGTTLTPESMSQSGSPKKKQTSHSGTDAKSGADGYDELLRKSLNFRMVDLRQCDLRKLTLAQVERLFSVANTRFKELERGDNQTKHRPHRWVKVVESVLATHFTAIQAAGNEKMRKTVEDLRETVRRQLRYQKEKKKFLYLFKEAEKAVPKDKKIRQDYYIKRTRF